MEVCNNSSLLIWGGWNRSHHFHTHTPFPSGFSHTATMKMQSGNPLAFVNESECSAVPCQQCTQAKSAVMGVWTYECARSKDVIEWIMGFLCINVTVSVQQTQAKPFIIISVFWITLSTDVFGAAGLLLSVTHSLLNLDDKNAYTIQRENHTKSPSCTRLLANLKIRTANCSCWLI